MTSDIVSALTTGNKLISVELAGQRLGIDVADVHDVIRLAAFNRVPLAPSWVAGVMNLRGRIVTAIDLRARFGLTPRPPGEAAMCVVIEHRGEPYGLIVDEVGDVIDVYPEQIEPNPVTLDARWQQASDGIVKLDQLMIIANVAAVMDGDLASAA
jgi:purine-binding chemotaxis protein CheW